MITHEENRHIYYTYFVSKASTWKMAQPVALGIAWHSLGTAERTVSKSCGLHTVTQSGRLSISRSSLMVNATCNGPLRPISFTRRTLLCDSASRACSVMSVLYKNHQLLYITSLFHFFQATGSSSWV